MSYTANMYGIKSMNIIRFLLQETGTFDEQYRRPFETNLSAANHGQLMNAIGQSGSITAAGMAGVANQFLKPSATPECLIQIPQGWGTKRLRFLLEIETTDRMGFKTTQSITGYTDHAGLSYNNAIDPNMMFFINNINVMRVQTNKTPLGNQTYQSLVDASHLLVNNQYTGITSPNKTYGLRPEDVYTQIDNATMQSELNDEFVLDSRSLITMGPKKSRRANAIAPVYVASVLDSYRQTAQGDWNQSDSQKLETASCSVQSDEAAVDPFLAFLKSKSPHESSNTFTFGDLMSLDANVVHVTKVDVVSPAMQGTLAYAGQSANWASTDYTTQFATTLAQAVPGYMLNYCLNKVHILSTNLDMGSRITSRFARAPGSLNRGMDITQQVTAFLYRLEVELLKDLSFNGQLGFQFEMICDLMGETRITLSLNGDPSVMYVTPSFCDAMMAPMVTGNQAVLGVIADNFSTLMRDMEENNPVGQSTQSAGLGYL